MSTIKECFTSRFEGGSLVQFDYSQLEVICLAFLTGDYNLYEDLVSGVDMHIRSASFMLGQSYESIKKAHVRGEAWALEARQTAKPLGFLVQYGGAAGLMAKQTGLSKKQCSTFIKGYYDRYHMVARWQDEVAADVEANAELSTVMIGNSQARMSCINSITGRRYTFVEQKAPVWSSRPTSFSPTQMKNFKIQGFATGDVVPLMLGRLNRWIYAECLDNKVKIVNTTHDSVMLDVHPDCHLSTLVKKVSRLLESAPQVLDEVFGIEFDLPLKVDAEVGPNWGALKKWMHFPA